MLALQRPFKVNRYPLAIHPHVNFYFTKCTPSFVSQIPIYMLKIRSDQQEIDLVVKVNGGLPKIVKLAPNGLPPSPPLLARDDNVAPVVLDLARFCRYFCPISGFKCIVLD